MMRLCEGRDLVLLPMHRLQWMLAMELRSRGGHGRGGQLPWFEV